MAKKKYGPREYKCRACDFKGSEVPTLTPTADPNLTDDYWIEIRDVSIPTPRVSSAPKLVGCPQCGAVRLIGPTIGD